MCYSRSYIEAFEIILIQKILLFQILSFSPIKSSFIFISNEILIDFSYFVDKSFNNQEINKTK